VDRLEGAREEQRLDIASLLASRRSWRWISGIGLPVLLASFVTVMLWTIDRVSNERARGGAVRGHDRIDPVQAQLLESYVHELLRHAGIDGKPLSITQGLGDAVPMSCGGGCTTSPECQGTGSCNYCYLGKCSSVLPAQPTRDAGVDAPGTLTEPKDTIASDTSKGPHYASVSNP